MFLFFCFRDFLKCNLIKYHLAISKPKRKRITPYQLNVLMELFKKNDTPNYQLREATAQKLNMTNREVQVINDL